MSDSKLKNVSSVMNSGNPPIALSAETLMIPHEPPKIAVPCSALDVCMNLKNIASKRSMLSEKNVPFAYLFSVCTNATLLSWKYGSRSLRKFLSVRCSSASKTAMNSSLRPFKRLFSAPALNPDLTSRCRYPAPLSRANASMLLLVSGFVESSSR